MLTLSVPRAIRLVNPLYPERLAKKMAGMPASTVPSVLAIKMLLLFLRDFEFEIPPGRDNRRSGSNNHTNSELDCQKP